MNLEFNSDRPKYITKMFHSN